MHLRRALLVLCAASATAGWAQPIVPTALSHSPYDVDAIDAVDFDALDLVALAAEDAARAEADLPPRFAIARPVSITPARRGTWEEIGDGRLLWRLRLRAAEAASLNLGFGRYRMPEGGQLLLYAADLTDQIRPFTAADNHADGELWTPLLPTADLVVELTIPRSRLGELELELVQVGQGYRALGLAESPLSGACNMDVECLLGADPWRDNVRAVGAITLGGTDNCSGSLLNNTAQDHKMYFMTANHCGIDAGDAGTVVVYWNFENSTCRTPGSAASGGAGDGVRNQFASGWTFRAARSQSDFTLIEYLGAYDPAWNLFWAGWDRSAGDADCSGQPCFACSDASLCAGIHHPGVDEKRITFVEEAMIHSVYGGGTVPPPGNDDSHLWVKWDPDPVFPPDPGIQPPIPPQVTEPGSSGSPVYSSARRFLGQLHGGPSACGSTGNNLSDYYGFLNMSWAAGGTPATQARNWLDPGDTGALTIDGTNFCTPTAAPGGLAATPNGDNRIDLAWGAVAGAESYNVYRALGACPGTGSSFLTNTAATTYSDLTVSGGLTYSYQVSAIDADADDCESVRSNCDDALATGACTLAPAFTGLASAESVGVSACGVDLTWPAASSSCGGGVVYNVYRSTDPGFVPGLANLLEPCVGTTFYQDTTAVYGTTYHYAVRAEDQTGDGGGLCAAGNEEQNVVKKTATPAGPDLDLFFDAIEGPTTAWTVDGTGGGADFAVSTAAAHSPTHSWFVPDPNVVSDRRLATAAPIVLPASPPSKLEFWHRFNTESSWDGGVLETSSDAVAWTDIGASRLVAGGYTGTLNSSGSNPLRGRPAWQGDIASFARVEANLADFAGQSLYFRWRFGSDASVADVGWYVDDVLFTYPDVCASGLLFADDYEAGPTWRWSEVYQGP